MEEFSSTGQLVTLGLVDSSIGAMTKGLALVDVEASIAKDWLCSFLIGHFPSYSQVIDILVSTISLVNPSQCSAGCCITNMGSTVHETQRNVQTKDYTLQETIVCIQCIDLYSRQIIVNHTLIFTLGTFKALLRSLLISKFQHGSQKLCQTQLLPRAGDAIHPVL